MALGGITPNINPFGFYDPVLAEMDPTPDTQTEKIAIMARTAIVKGIGDGGPVGDIKMHSDQSGGSGVNDYFSALGYDA